ncbi:MAG: response regulator [Anaerolineales bacterium]|nr:response regulator [Anaerolineales bacterium]
MEKTSETILLVEDNPDDIDLTLRALKKNRISNKVAIVRDGVEALEYLFAEGKYASRDLDDTPALVLLDLKLPKVDGIEVLERIRADERTKLLPVVMLTSSTDEADIIKSYQSGCNSYVKKPVDFSQFSEAVQQLGLYWLILNQRPPSAGR